MNPSLEQILNAIKNSGYLFEQEVGSIFEKGGFNIKTNVAFKDEDEDKSREIDVMAFRRQYYNEEKKISVTIRVLCECKNNMHPFIFICRNKSISDASYEPPNFQFPLDEYKTQVDGKPNSYRISGGFNYFRLNRYFPFHQMDYKAVQFCKMVRKGSEWSAQHEGIYDSILLPLIKCLEYYKKYDGEYKNSGGWKHYSIYFPVVVLNAELYTIKSHISSTNIETTPCISYLRDIHSKKIKGTYLIDFVNVNELSVYFENVFEFLNEFITVVLAEDSLRISK